MRGNGTYATGARRTTCCPTRPCNRAAVRRYSSVEWLAMRDMASAPLTLMASLCLLALAGCGSSREAARQTAHQEAFRQDTPFTTRVTGRGEDVCWSVKRAFLSQGYMLDRGGDTLVLSGT